MTEHPLATWRRGEFLALTPRQSWAVNRRPAHPQGRLMKGLAEECSLDFRGARVTRHDSIHATPTQSACAESSRSGEAPGPALLECAYGARQNTTI